MSSDNSSIDAATAILLRGCLGGVGLAVVFLVISGVTFLVLSAVTAPRNLMILFSVASGPVIGSGAALLLVLRRLSREQGTSRQIEHNDEASSRDAA